MKHSFMHLLSTDTDALYEEHNNNVKNNSYKTFLKIKVIYYLLKCFFSEWFAID